MNMIGLRKLNILSHVSLFYLGTTLEHVVFLFFLKMFSTMIQYGQIYIVPKKTNASNVLTKWLQACSGKVSMSNKVLC